MKCVMILNLQDLCEVVGQPTIEEREVELRCGKTLTGKRLNSNLLQDKVKENTFVFIDGEHKFPVTHVSS